MRDGLLVQGPAGQFNIQGQFPGRDRLHTVYKCSISHRKVSDGPVKERGPRQIPVTAQVPYSDSFTPLKRCLSTTERKMARVRPIDTGREGGKQYTVYGECNGSIYSYILNMLRWSFVCAV